MAASPESSVDKKEISSPTSLPVSYKVKAGIFLASVAGFGFIAGFGSSLAATKKKGLHQCLLTLIGLDFLLILKQ
jgi:hypothetical protein